MALSAIFDLMAVVVICLWITSANCRGPSCNDIVRPVDGSLHFMHTSLRKKGRLESCEDGPLREGPRDKDPSLKALEGGLSHWVFGRAMRRLGRTVAEHSPWVRSKSLAEPEAQLTPVVQQGSQPRWLRLHGSPLTALAVVVLLAAPVVVIHSALTSSTSLFSSTAGSLTASQASGGKWTPSPTPTPTATSHSCSSGYSWGIDSEFPNGGCCPNHTSDSDPSGGLALGPADLAATPAPTPTPTPTATPPPTPLPSINVTVTPTPTSDAGSGG
jgi:hypothetical protein